MAKKSNNLYVCQGTSSFDKNMESRGVAIETVYYPSIKKGTKVYGIDTCCVIEQKGEIICNRKKANLSCWVEDIEKLTPNIKGSFFGLGDYKDVYITGFNTKAISMPLKLSAKSSNGITCFFSDNILFSIQSIDIQKFRKWMKEWGHQFGLKKKGNVWMTKAELQVFISKAVIPASLEKSVKTINAPTSSAGVFTMTEKNAKVVYDEVEKMVKDYFSNSLGFDIYFTLHSLV